MKLLLDNNISPRVKSILQSKRIEVLHVADLNMSKATDTEIFNYAYLNNFVIISSDTDFGYILSKRRNNFPSVILLRYLPYDSDLVGAYISKGINKFKSELDEKSILVIEPKRMRIKKLPISSQ
ncbi:MAG: DUF5615 family PIN-like protein [Melioribacteraceae bacterium]|nr:DUF5615 family PIN-like protein [Melioribacteraceae bacterium]MCF8355284.1 DUF5615 family PIN-like protein [Melioribacteraceae bacterium]MCF8394130.1 DUF5615 family PIN-like protein [Melioribacteraceae bacterium]MCF8418131.1 DUF5615 family PIN-like protein [Melioribacteraceae bacterium]